MIPDFTDTALSQLWSLDGRNRDTSGSKVDSGRPHIEALALTELEC